jgi:hypothetical protein
MTIREEGKNFESSYCWPINHAPIITEVWNKNYQSLIKSFFGATNICWILLYDAPIVLINCEKGLPEEFVIFEMKGVMFPLNSGTEIRNPEIMALHEPFKRLYVTLLRCPDRIKTFTFKKIVQLKTIATLWIVWSSSPIPHFAWFQIFYWSKFLRFQSLIKTETSLDLLVLEENFSLAIYKYICFCLNSDSYASFDYCYD